MTAPKKADLLDLLWMRDWIESFDPDGESDDAEDTERKARVLAWIEVHIERQKAKEANDELINTLAERLGVTKDRVRRSKTYKDFKR